MHRIQLFIFIQALAVAAPFGISSCQLQRREATYRPHRTTRLHENNQPQDKNGSIDSAGNDGGSSYESSASLTKGLVSSLTSLSTSIFEGGSTKLSEEIIQSSSASSKKPPTSPQDLQSRIQNEYTVNNYLWTGKLDTSSFVSNCTFTDPTLSFVGVDKYIQNVGSLVPVVEYLLGDDDKQKVSKSDLLSITLNDKEKYVETRWNMVGELNRLFWKPRIDVIGRTKFWYQEKKEEEDGQMYYQVYFYDEEWEIPAGLALLQLVTKAGTIANTSE